MKHIVATILSALVLLIAPLPSLGAPEQAPSGKLTIEQYQAAWIVSGNLGGGVLDYKGKSYHFEVGGIGVGGIGFSKITAVGTVYGLKRLEDFSGVYGQARYGVAAADKSSGMLWLQNAKGVVISLNAKRQGLALSLGADGVVFDLRDQ